MCVAEQGDEIVDRRRGGKGDGVDGAAFEQLAQLLAASRGATGVGDRGGDLRIVTAATVYKGSVLVRRTTTGRVKAGGASTRPRRTSGESRTRVQQEEPGAARSDLA